MKQEDKCLIAECEAQIAELKETIKQAKARCEHERKIDRRYVDYDRTCYEVKCADCGEIIFDGNPFEYRKYLEALDAKL
jgi:hypothetical protein